jgi:hypothetical protein
MWNTWVRFLHEKVYFWAQVKVMFRNFLVRSTFPQLKCSYRATLLTAEKNSYREYADMQLQSNIS